MEPIEFHFDIPDRELWKEKIIKELKENSDKVIFKNEIEGISFDITEKQTFSFEVSDKRTSNDWKNCFYIDVIEEKTANSICLNALMSGADSLFLNIKKNTIDWAILSKGIEFDYISTRIKFSSFEGLNSFLAFKSAHPNIQFLVDPLTYHENLKEFDFGFLLNGFELQQIGANTWQEAGILLSTFHELLIQDKNQNTFHVHLGIGSNYFVEIAKIRAIKWLFNHLCTTYNISEPKLIFSAETGFVNKSLKDPHTNLLRQSTEAMAALTSGISELTIRPYDEFSESGSSHFTRRMALNISNILKEESYFDFVKDPLKGSNVVELLTQEIIENSWNFFTSLEPFKSINSLEKLNYLKQEIEKTRNKRIASFQQNEIKLIGVNCFLNNEEDTNQWIDNKYIDIPYLILEKYS
jgi:methylmalonyl-CoA mutase